AEPRLEGYRASAEALRPHAAHPSLILNKALDEGTTVSPEATHGSRVAIGPGTYPFATSRSPTAAGAAAAAALAATRIPKTIGIPKAYTTRVASGPVPTELLDEEGEWLRRHGGEYGVTTGRGRRCGWFDAPIARYATRINGITDFF